MACNLLIKPAPGERIETALVLPEPENAAIFGRVQRADGTPVPGVLSLLFREDDSMPSDQCITDEYGRFCFGPLSGNTLYTVHLHERHRNARILEVSL